MKLIFVLSCVPIFRWPMFSHMWFIYRQNTVHVLSPTMQQQFNGILFISNSWFRWVHMLRVLNLVSNKCWLQSEYNNYMWSCYLFFFVKSWAGTAESGERNGRDLSWDSKYGKEGFQSGWLTNLNSKWKRSFTRTWSLAWSGANENIEVCYWWRRLVMHECPSWVN